MWWNEVDVAGEHAGDHGGGPSLLTVREVADAMRVSTMTVYRLIRAGDLPAIRVGTHFRIRDADLAAYLDARTVRGGDPWPAA